MRFYLGTHRPHWLELADGPLFLSRRQLIDARLPVARVPWVLDSGAFTELRAGGWGVSMLDYAREVQVFRDEIGMLEWAAPMDWVCSPKILERTRSTVAEHQGRTIASYLMLRWQVGDVIAPVLQGWTSDDYLRCAEGYERAGVDLAAAPVVAVGSICRTADPAGVHQVLRTLAPLGFRLHALGVRARVLAATADVVASADSMAWSLEARLEALKGKVPDHSHPRGGRSCQNCLIYAERWRRRSLATLESSLLYNGGAA